MTSTDPTPARTRGVPQHPVSVCIGAVRVAQLPGWDDAIAWLRADITRQYRPNGPMSSPGHIALAREAAELREVDAGPQNYHGRGTLTTNSPWAWGGSLRYAVDGEHGLAAGDLAILRDVTNGRSSWTIDVKCRITHVDAESHRVTVRVTGDSAQFARGEITTVYAASIRRRPASRH